MGDLLIHFCVMARGSLSETVNHLMDTLHEGYIIEETFTDIKKPGKGIERMMMATLPFFTKKEMSQNNSPVYDLMLFTGSNPEPTANTLYTYLLYILKNDLRIQQLQTRHP
jgi:hypothetical protein